MGERDVGEHSTEEHSTGQHSAGQHSAGQHSAGQHSAGEHGAGQPGDWQATLRDKGYRLTPQRELVLAAVERLGHATPDEILTAVRQESQAVNVSTVYRTLELLEELGLVRHAHIADRAPTYHSAAHPAHVHLVCRTCGRVEEVTAEEVAPFTTMLQERHGFATDVGHLTVFGTCRDCLAS